MSDQRSWGDDTVALGQKARPRAGEPEQPQGPATGPRLPRPTRRTLSLGALAAVALVTWMLSGGGGGSGPSKAPIRDVADPAPRVVVKPPTLMRRPEPRPPRPRVPHRAAGQIEGRREPNVSAPPHELDAPVLTPEPVIEPAPEPTPAPAPTSPAAEFGM
jgi:hypothetical protein